MGRAMKRIPPTQVSEAEIARMAPDALIKLEELGALDLAEMLGLVPQHEDPAVVDGYQS